MAVQRLPPLGERQLAASWALDALRALGPGCSLADLACGKRSSTIGQAPWPSTRRSNKQERALGAPICACSIWASRRRAAPPVRRRGRKGKDVQGRRSGRPGKTRGGKKGGRSRDRGGKGGQAASTSERHGRAKETQRRGRARESRRARTTASSCPPIDPHGSPKSAATPPLHSAPVWCHPSPMCLSIHVRGALRLRRPMLTKWSIRFSSCPRTALGGIGASRIAPMIHRVLSLPFPHQILTIYPLCPELDL